MREKNLYQFDPINLLRVYATLLVFLLHASIFSGQVGFKFSEKTFILQTPAWSAVWIFLILSGYLTGKQFFTKKYELTRQGIMSFYVGRFFKVALPTYIFVFVCCVVLEPRFIFDNPRVIVQFLTSTFNNSIGFNAIGPTWYVFTLLWLYLISPILIKLVIELNRKNKFKYMNEVLIIIAIILGFILRYIGYLNQWNWSEKIYTPFYMNIDIFFSGILFSYIRCSKTRNNGTTKLSCYIITFLLVLIVCVNSYIYYHNDYFVYQYIFPSIYIIVTGLYLLLWDSHDCKDIRLPWVVANIINKFSNITFSFYLLHCVVLESLSCLIKQNRPFYMHIELLLVAFVVTILLSKVYNFINIGCIGIIDRKKNQKGEHIV